jgi:phosphopantothenoylcysteine decarboxylase/phosphopantothenate--cysteine ligase
MNSICGKRILLGVCGGIAAYKSADLARKLRVAGAVVRVVMTQSAREFVTPRTLQAVTGERVWSDWRDDRTAMEHIELAHWAECILLAPATADTLARLAHGRANDLLAAVCLASSAPLCVAPAMNQAMWNHPATQHNIRILRQRGAAILGPASGDLACGETGPGRMLEPNELVARLSASFSSGLLAGLKVVISAGPTREPLDPVRFISNRSSGKMGYAVARAAREAGAAVELVSGPVSLQVPAGVDCVHVETAAEMYQAVLARMQGCDVFVAAAAVADYRPAHPAGSKLKKEQHGRSLELEPVPDILARVAGLERRPFCVGFAAETERVEENANRKRMQKGIELIAANRVGAGLGFDVDDNELLLIWEGGSCLLERENKQVLAGRLVEQIATLHARKQSQAKSVERHAKHSA